MWARFQRHMKRSASADLEGGEDSSVGLKGLRARLLNGIELHEALHELRPAGGSGEGGQCAEQRHPRGFILYREVHSAEERGGGGGFEGGSCRGRGGAAPLGGAGSNADEHSPLSCGVDAVVDDLRAVEVGGAVEDLGRGALALRFPRERSWSSDRTGSGVEGLRRCRGLRTALGMAFAS